jgi:phage terminase large subunit-like protein
VTEKENVIETVFGGVDLSAVPEEEDILAAIEKSVAIEEATSQRKGNTMSHAEKIAVLEVLREYEKRQQYQGHMAYFPDEGPYRYENYPKHIEFMKAGAVHRERIFMAANRVGKSITGAYELTCHLTGLYPKWWEGRRFTHATDCWASGDTSQTTRDIVQRTLLGEIGEWGTGMIPKERIEKVRMRAGIPGGVDSIMVRHTCGDLSYLGFKSYDQKRRAFQGTQKHAIWLDEEPPLEVYGECLIRTMTTGGVVFVTFTPLQGLTPFVTEFRKQANEQELNHGDSTR